MAKCRVTITYDEGDDKAYAECLICTWAASGSVKRVEDAADQHEQRKGNE